VPDGDGPRHRAERLLDLYLNDAETIFPGGGPASLPQRVREGARYSVAGLERLLDSYLADTPLTAALIDVVVTSYDLAYGEPVMLSSRPREGFVTDVSMVVAARATCAAPTFFKPQVLLDGDRERILVDGGVYVNNPAVLGYLLGVQVAANVERPLVLVSLGTGARPPRTPLSAAEAHLGDSFGAARTLLEAVASGSGHLLHGLLTRLADAERFRYWRLQTTVGPCSFTMDDSRPENVDCLSARAREFVSQSDQALSAIARALAG
jgi:predicted acylesterase/phospholipase RssA